MIEILANISIFIALILSAYHRLSLVLTLSGVALYIVSLMFTDILSLFFGMLWLIFLGVSGFIFLDATTRRNKISRPILKRLTKTMSKISATEEIALSAGSVWWDGELFTGKPNWNKLRATSKPKLTQAEKDFLAGPVEKLCQMIDDWEIMHQQHDLSPKIWQFIKQNKFFGLIIPPEYGGLGFSGYAHSEILAKIAGYSITVATTVSVPNSLGPAELLLKYGTQEQKDYYLPKLAIGEEIPCFALTNPEAGSDATAIPDTGIVCRQDFNGKSTLGFKLNWNKRYITLAPVATVVGLAFKALDPDKLIGDQVELGITCALIPASTPGISIGNRHYPLHAYFQNGPTQGKDVFIPLDWVIGSPKMIGEGWRMLVECLSCGRAISLPSCSAGMIRLALASTGAYAKIRRQFNQPIGKFEGVAEGIAKIANHVYTVESIRKFTAHGIDLGERPSVLGAIVKAESTERSAFAFMEAMEIHAGKAIILGPKNYLAQGYLNAPIGITVEGANILTKNLIIFGQGAVRCHPFIRKELDLLSEPESREQLVKFDRLLMKHLSLILRNCSRSFLMAITGGKLINAPGTRIVRKYYQKLSWLNSVFAFIADVSLVLFGGKLKFKERISKRLGRLLSLQYLAMCSIKQFENDGCPLEDEPLVTLVLEDKIYNFWLTLDELLANIPYKYLRVLLKVILMPLGNPQKPDFDRLDNEVADSFQYKSATRQRLIGDLFLHISNEQAITKLEAAFVKILAAEPIEKRLLKLNEFDKKLSPENLLARAIELNKVNNDETAILQAAIDARKEVIAVDDFPPLKPKSKKKRVRADSL